MKITMETTMRDIINDLNERISDIARTIEVAYDDAYNFKKKLGELAKEYTLTVDENYTLYLFINIFYDSCCRMYLKRNDFDISAGNPAYFYVCRFKGTNDYERLSIAKHEGNFAYPCPVPSYENSVFKKAGIKYSIDRTIGELYPLMKKALDKEIKAKKAHQAQEDKEKREAVAKDEKFQAALAICKAHGLTLEEIEAIKSIPLHDKYYLEAIKDAL